MRKIFVEWFKLLLTVASEKRQAEAVTLCWSIWRSRNDKVWNKKSSFVNRVVATTKQYLTQWQMAQSRFYTASLQPVVEGDGAVVWVKPLTNEVKISVDAAIFEEQVGVGFGLVMRDSNGQLIEAKALVHSVLVAPVLGEVMAVKEALSWCDSMPEKSITIESDCLVVVQAIRSSTHMRSYFGGIVEDCRRLLKRLNKVSLFFVKRSANMVAHNLAKESYRYSGRTFNRSSVPIEIQNCIEDDLSA